MNIIITDEKELLRDSDIELLNEAAAAVLEQELAADSIQGAAEAVTELASTELPVEISLTIVDRDEIREINRNYRSVDSVTDVLSFPQYASPEEAADEVKALLLENSDGLKEFEEFGISECEDETSQQEILLGDVVICYDRVMEQAAEFGHGEDRELAYLFVHSMLHLLGYDHMSDDEKEIMRRHEEAVMDRLELQR